MSTPEMARKTDDSAAEEALELARFTNVEDATFEAYLSDYVLALPVCKGWGCH